MKGKKTGGRKPGTPNKDKPLKDMLRGHSTAYFSPNPQNPDCISDFELNLEALTPIDRVNAEIKLLEFHTPKQKAVDVDINATITQHTIEAQLRQLCNLDDEQ